MRILVGPGHGYQAYIIIETPPHSDDIERYSFDTREEAEIHLDSSENKAYLICVEGVLDGVFEINIEPHT